MIFERNFFNEVKTKQIRLIRVPCAQQTIIIYKNPTYIHQPKKMFVNREF